MGHRLAGFDVPRWMLDADGVTGTNGAQVGF